MRALNEYIYRSHGFKVMGIRMGIMGIMSFSDVTICNENQTQKSEKSPDKSDKDNAAYLR